MITSLPTEMSAEEVLACYRLRWQVELVFKRLKSLLQIGNIPTKSKEGRETKLALFIIFMMILPNKSAMLIDILENSFLHATIFIFYRDIL